MWRGRALRAAEVDRCRVRTGDVGTELRTTARLLPAFQGQPSARSSPFFPALPRCIPDEAGPLCVSHASCHRSRTSKDTVSFHFQLCQMVLLCNQIWLRPRIDPKAPSDLMTFPRILFSLTLCLVLQHPDVSWGWNSTGRAQG